MNAHDDVTMLIGHPGGFKKKESKSAVFQLFFSCEKKNLSRDTEKKNLSGERRLGPF